MSADLIRCECQSIHIIFIIIMNYYNIQIKSDIISNMIMTPQSQQKPTEQQLQSFKDNKIFRKTFKNLVHRLLHQFRSENYDANSIISNEYAIVNQLLSTTQQKLAEYSSIANQDQSVETQSKIQDQKIKIYRQLKEIQQLKRIWQEISIFIWQLGYSPKCYVQMFYNEEIHAEQTEVIDMHIFTSKIYKRVFKAIKEFTIYVHLFEEIAADQIYFFLEEVSQQICSCFSSSRKIIISQVQYATQAVQKSKIVNFYVLFKIFKDVASRCKERIVYELELGIFRNVETQVLYQFAHYVIEKYQVLKLQMKKDQELKDIELRRKPSIVDQIMTSNSISWREAVGEDGQIGILVEINEDGQNKNEEGLSKKKNYMLMLDDEGEVKVMHCNSLYKKWKVCKKVEKNYDIVKLIKNQKALAARLRGTDASNQVRVMTMVDNVNLVGGTMGRTLAEIDQFDNAGDFVATLSKRMIVGGSISYMISSVPLLGYIFITGGYTYSFYYIFNNKYSNSSKKLREVRNMTLNAASSVGSGIVGALIGQSLIPIPVLGAFIGGFIGGFVGEFGGRAVNDLLETVKFKQTIQQLDLTLQPKGYWQVNKRTLKILEIKQQKFYETIPSGLQHKMNCDRIWITLIFFTMFTFSESEKRVKFLNKKLKEMKKLENYEIIEENFDVTGKDEYQPSLNILCIMNFLEENHIYYLDFHDQIAQIMNKMFSRLK